MPGQTRPLRVGAFDVLDGRIVAVDDVIPVVVEVDPAHGVTATHTWDLDPELRGRPTAKDVVATPTSIVVASPAAGGVARIDRRTGETTVVRLPDDVGWLRADGELIWAVADPDAPTADEAFAVATARRPVVWEEPTAEDMERHGQRMSGWMVQAPNSEDEWVPMADPDEPIPTVAHWQSTDNDESDLIAPLTSVWIIDGDTATIVDFGGEVSDLASVEGRIVAVCRLPTDPLIKRVEAGGYLSYIRPGTVLFDSGGQLRPLGNVGETLQGAISVDGDDVWLLGFNGGRDDEEFEVRRVDLGSGEIGPARRAAEEVVAVVGGRLIQLGWAGDRGWDDDGADDDADEPCSPMRLVRVATASGDTDRIVEIPVVDTTPVVDGNVVWFRRYDSPRFVGVGVMTGAVSEVSVHADLARFVPSVAPPSDVDLAAYEAGELEKMRNSLLGGWRSESGEQHAFIRGITFESVELEDEFPHTAVVARFRADNRPGMLFGRRWNLYDDLGNVGPLDYVDIHLMEDIEAAGYGLPPMSKCTPDESGIVWF